LRILDTICWTEPRCAMGIVSDAWVWAVCWEGETNGGVVEW